jgi:hypothetical protein
MELSRRCDGSAHASASDISTSDRANKKGGIAAALW